MSWFSEKGEMQDVVISTRVRFARNLEGYPFEDRLKNNSALEIIDKVASALPDYSVEKFTTGEKSKLRSYMEMHYVSPEFAEMQRPRALLSGENDCVKIMVCEEDHIRIQAIVAGFDPEKALTYAGRADKAICGKLDIAFSEKYGYLTHCPTNLGEAMRVSAMLKLPALTLTSSIEGYSRALNKLGITIRGIYGEGSGASGCLYQISNRSSLGMNEEAIIRMITDVVKNLVKDEQKARKALFEARKDDLTDRISRSVGLLSCAHLLSSEEFNRCFADLTMGVSLGVIEGISSEKLSELMIAVQPATISLTSAGGSDEVKRDYARAKLVRSIISQIKVNH